MRPRPFVVGVSLLVNFATIPQLQAMSCKDGELWKLTSSPIGTGDISALIPLGRLSPEEGHVFPSDRLLFVPGASGDAVKVYSPGKIVITRALESRNGASRSWELRFRICDEAEGALSGITRLDPGFAAQSGIEGSASKTCLAQGTPEERCEYATHASVKSGQLLGYRDPGSLSAGVELGVYDSRVTLPSANPSRYAERPDALHAACPFDYFVNPVDYGLRDFLGTYDYCGIAMLDMPGTALGNWFRDGLATYPETPHLALAYDNIYRDDTDAAIGAISMGDSLPGVPSGVYYFNSRDHEALESITLKDKGVPRCYDRLYSDHDLIHPVRLAFLLALDRDSAGFDRVTIEGKPTDSCGTPKERPLNWKFTASARSFHR